MPMPDVSGRSFIPMTVEASNVIITGGTRGAHVQFTLIQVLHTVRTHISSKTATEVSIRVVRTRGIVLAGSRQTMVNGRFTRDPCKSLMTCAGVGMGFIQTGRPVLARVGMTEVILLAIRTYPIFCAVACVARVSIDTNAIILARIGAAIIALLTNMTCPFGCTKAGVPVGQGRARTFILTRIWVAVVDLRTIGAYPLWLTLTSVSVR